MTTPATVVVEPMTVDRLADLRALFGTTKTTSGCYCMWFVQPAGQSQASWGEANRDNFEALAHRTPQPLGVLAYRAGEPVGWCAVGPRDRYGRVLRSKLLNDRDPAEDPTVWLVTCFYITRRARNTGITHHLLSAAVELARRHKATAIEGFPIAGDARRSAAESFVGVESVFASNGFAVIGRPSASRVVMRRALP